MKKYLLTGALVTIIATTIYAQTAGTSSIIMKMKAAAANFTLTELIPSGQTGLTSAPLVAKKTGDILTAGEYNRLLEMIAQGGTGTSGWENVLLTDSADYDTSCLYRYFANYIVDDANRKWMNSTSAIVYIEAVSSKYLRRDLDLANNVMWGVQSSNKSQYGNRNSSGVFTPANNIQITRMEKLCGGGGGGSTGGTPSNLVYINPENTDFAAIECTPGVNYMITPIAFNAASASTYTDKKLAVLKSGNWRARGTSFIRNRNTNPDSSHTFRFNSVLDGTTTKLFENTVDTGIYASAFSENITVPAGKTAEINVSVRNNAIYGGTVTLWCTN